MADMRTEEERLPWIGAPRGSKPVRAPMKAPPKAARRARAPIFILLSLFLIAAVGVMSYLVGRGSVPVSPTSVSQPAAPAATKRAPVALPPAPPPLPVEQSPDQARVAERPTLPVEAEPSTASTRRPTTGKPRTSPARRGKAAPSARAMRARQALRQMPPLVKASPVVQLGIYNSRGQANAAYRRLAKVYPYLDKRPRDVRVIKFSDNNKVYQLRLREYSPEYARILCGNLRAIGRGCTVLPVA